MLAILLAFAGSIAARPVSADLIGLHWDDYGSLQQLSRADDYQLRYVNGKVALFEVAGELIATDPSLLFRDIPEEGEAYYLVDHLHGHEPAPGVRIVYADDAGWALLRLPTARLAQVLEGESFLFPLPESFELRSPRRAAARPLDRDPSPAVATLIDAIDPARLQQHVEILSFHDPAQGAIAGNVRTRYARRPETFESTLYLQQQLETLLPTGTVRLDTFRIMPDDSLMYNVVAELPGTDPTAGHYIVCAHYDAIGSRSRASHMATIGETDPGWRWQDHPAPGADDNGTGVALMLESARALAQAPRPPWSIRFIAWSGEELGLRGSRHYAEVARRANDHILGVLNFDMIGFNDLVNRVELVTNPSSAWLVDHLIATNDRYDIGLQIDVLADPFAGLSDHAPFWVRGYDAILGIENYLPTDSSHVSVLRGDYRVNPQYHTVVDLPDSINWELVADITRLTVAGLAQFGQEQGLANLAVFTGDVRSVEDDLRIHVTNLGVSDVTTAFDLRVSKCDQDSTSCSIVYEQPVTTGLPAGSVAQIDIPWRRFGNTVLLIEVDPDDRIAEEGSDSDNRVFQQLRIVPTTGIVVFPNPYRVGRDDGVYFSGLPLFSRVQILSPGGDLVWEGREEDQGELSGEIRWGGTNTNGFAVASNVYIYIVRSFEGEMIRRGKVAVVR